MSFNDFIVAIGLVAVSPAMGQQIGTPEFDPLGEHLNLQKQIRIQVEYIEVGEERFTELMAPVRDGANDTDLREEARALVKNGEGRMLESMVLTTRSGQRAKLESIEEFIYATEIEPGQVPDLPEGGMKSKEAVKAAIIPASPTAFDVRNVGATCEVDPVIGNDDATVDLNLAPEVVYLAGESEVEEWKTEVLERKLSQPIFYTVRISTAVSVLHGHYHMIGAMSPKNDEGKRDPTKKVMIFVRVDILSVGK